MAVSLRSLLKIAVLCLLLMGCASRYQHPSRVLDDSSGYATVQFIADKDSDEHGSAIYLETMLVTLDDARLVRVPFGKYCTEQIKPGTYRLIIGRTHRKIWQYLPWILYYTPVIFTSKQVTFEEGKSHYYLLGLLLDTDYGFSSITIQDVGEKEGKALLDTHVEINPEL